MLADVRGENLNDLGVVGYEPATIRWLARLCLERPTVGFDDLTHLLAAFEALLTQPTEAWAALTTIYARHGIPTSALPA